MRLSAVPEVAVALYAFLLHFVWEFWQIAYFVDMPELSHRAGTWLCTQATFGDVVITLAAFWSTALWVRSRDWIHLPGRRADIIFIIIGILTTIAVEWLATTVVHRWQYAATMPTIPGLGTGLMPLLQWLVVPHLILALVRQLRR